MRNIKADSAGRKRLAVCQIQPHPGDAVRQQRIEDVDGEIVGQCGRIAQIDPALGKGGLGQFEYNHCWIRRIVGINQIHRIRRGSPPGHEMRKQRDVHR